MHASFQWISLSRRILPALLLAFSFAACGGDEPGGADSPDSFSMGGSVSGLDGTLILQLNGANDLTLSADGPFLFSVEIESGKAWAVTILTQPALQSCSVEMGSGTLSDANISDIEVSCTYRTYAVGGSVSGLSGSLVLQNNGGDDLSLSADGDFHFASDLAHGDTYSVTIKTQPNGQSCVVSQGAGTISGAVVSDIAVSCTTHSYAVGGSVSGLSGTVVLLNNDGDELTLTENGDFAFSTEVAHGEAYAVTVKTQPDDQSCEVSAGSGTVDAAVVSTVEISCANNPHVVGGSVTGLEGESVVLQLNGGEELTVSADASFSFSSELYSGDVWEVTIAGQEGERFCTIENGVGTVSGADISDIQVHCALYAFFGAYDFIYGTHLWRTDGTEAGTLRMDDPADELRVNYDPDDNNGIAHNGLFYFVAESENEGEEVWVSDGSEHGAWLLKDLWPGSDGSEPYEFAALGDHVFFVALDSVSGSERLWMTDGTEAGTQIVTPDALSEIIFYGVMNGKLYFTAYTEQTHYDLWVTDGTEAGTHIVHDMGFEDYSSMGKGVIAGDKIFYSGYGGSTDNYELWVSDGTDGGTTQVKEINASAGSYPDHLTPIGDKILFSASDAEGLALWVSDGTEVGTKKLLAINYLRDGFSTGDMAYFSLDDGSNGRELWRTDGTVAGTVMVKDILPNAGGDPRYFALFEGQVFFSANDENGAREPWVSDGTEAGTHLLVDADRLWHSFPSYLTALDEGVFFIARDADLSYEPWLSDGTDEGTQLIKDINTKEENPYPQYYTVGANGFLYFAANDYVHGSELWVSDGTSDGTYMALDLNVGSNGSNPGHRDSPTNDMVVFKDALFFTALGEGVYGRPQIYTGDGTAEGTSVLLAAAPLVESYDYRYLTPGATKMIFTANHPTHGVEPWVTDGTPENTFLLKDIYAGTSSSSLQHLAAMGDSFFFNANDGTNGTELWKSDGTEAGTVMVKDIYEGTASGSPQYLTPQGDKVFFSAQDNTHGNELWVSDGTEAGTWMVKDITAGSGGTSPREIKAFGDQVVFKHFLSAEVYISDGTEAGTKVIKEINPTGNSQIYQLTVVGDKLFFYANDGTHGNELWVSDGTEEGTNMVRDLTPGAGGTSFNYLTAGDGLLFFTATVDSSYDRELWVSDGTSGGTRMVKDINEARSSSPGNFFFHDGLLYFTATTADGDISLWVSDGTEAGTRLFSDINQVATDSCRPT